MKTTENPEQEQPQKTRFLSPWLAHPLALIAWWVIPWAISLLSRHYGWTASRPGIWNWLGLVPVLIGTIGLLWGVAVHSAQSPQGIEWEPDKSYLLSRGLYAYSRNPMYVSELVLLLGWIVFYGSVALVIAFLIWYIAFNYYIIPQEERVLEAHFGEAYRDYKKKVRRWL